MAVRPGARDNLNAALLAWWRDHRRRHTLTESLRTLLAELWGFLRESTPEQRRRRYGDIEYDWDHHVDTTSATVPWRERLLGVFHSPYQPTDPALFHEMLKALQVDFTDFTFIDLGSGKGRALLMASDYSCRRILGVELLPELHRIAQENLHKYKSATQKCFTTESRYEDASDFDFPPEPTVLYLFNPLPEPALEKVVANLDQSLREHPRKVFVLYHNPLLEHVLAASHQLKRTGGTHQYSVYESAPLRNA